MSDSPSRQDVARQFLTVAAEKVAEADYGRRHFIYLAREDLSWSEIAQILGLSEKTCRTYYQQYLEERRGVAA